MSVAAQHAHDFTLAEVLIDWMARQFRSRF